MFVQQNLEKADETVTDGDILNLGKEELKIIHTLTCRRGYLHTGWKAFTGDTLFYRSIGRTDLGDGNDERWQSPFETYGNGSFLIVLPGHGTFSNNRDERKLIHIEDC